MVELTSKEKSNLRAKKWYLENRELAISRSQKWHRDNFERKKQLQRISDLRRNFGITQEEYDELLAKQNGVCAICEEKQSRKGRLNLAVDHSHETGEIRGLLCDPCNQGLGSFKDSPELLDKAKEYLRKNKIGQVWKN